MAVLLYVLDSLLLFLVIRDGLLRELHWTDVSYCFF